LNAGSTVKSWLYKFWLSSYFQHLKLLAQEIEDSFSEKKKAGAVFVDLTAAYDTAWQRGLT